MLPSISTKVKLTTLALFRLKCQLRITIYIYRVSFDIRLFVTFTERESSSFHSLHLMEGGEKNPKGLRLFDKKFQNASCDAFISRGTNYEMLVTSVSQIVI